MKDRLLAEARDNGHVMVPVAPGRYECRDCSASLENDQIGCGNTWQSSKTGTLCPGSRQESSGPKGSSHPLVM